MRAFIRQARVDERPRSGMQMIHAVCAPLPAALDLREDRGRLYYVVRDANGQARLATTQDHAAKLMKSSWELPRKRLSPVRLISNWPRYCFAPQSCDIATASSNFDRISRTPHLYSIVTIIELRRCTTYLPGHRTFRQAVFLAGVLRLYNLARGIGHPSVAPVGRVPYRHGVRNGVGFLPATAAGRYSHPRSPNAERSTPGGAYHPAEP
jgi:hypothetical protein